MVRFRIGQPAILFFLLFLLNHNCAATKLLILMIYPLYCALAVIVVVVIFVVVFVVAVVVVVVLVVGFVVVVVVFAVIFCCCCCCCCCFCCCYRCCYCCCCSCCCRCSSSSSSLHCYCLLIVYINDGGGNIKKIHTHYAMAFNSAVLQSHLFAF